jgi:hypothetical protein
VSEQVDEEDSVQPQPRPRPLKIDVPLYDYVDRSGDDLAGGTETRGQ